jgi:hypothetical protein
VQKHIQIRKKTPEEQWFHLIGTAKTGPLSMAQLKAAAANGNLPPDAAVWRADIPVRVPAGCLPWLFPAGKAGAFDPGAALPPEPEQTCARCGHRFTASMALYVARDPRLPPDPLLHPGEPYRFLPSRFTPDGQAIDPGGMLTDETACPACHASLTQPPRPLPAAAAGALGQSAAVRTLAGSRTEAAGATPLPPALATVDGVRQLVADLRGMLSRQAGTRTSGEQLARQYAELCRVVAVRLDLCARLMAADMRDEAIRQSNTPPQLSEICALLTFPELDDWRQLCARNRWPMPDRVDAAAAQAIEKTERAPVAVEATLRALRHAVAARRFDLSVRLFHTLMLMDTENARWKEDAAAFEACRQQELIEACQAAIAAEDLPALSKLMDELTGPWVSRPPDAILTPLISELQRLRTADAIVSGRALARRFAAACQSHDFAAAAASATEYETLIQSGVFNPDAATRTDWEAGQSWYRKVCAQNEAAARMARDIAALEAELAKPEPAPGIDAMLSALIAAGAPLDAGLRQRAEAAIANRRRRERRLRLRRLAVRAAILLLGLSVLAWGAWQTAYTHQLRTWNKQLTAPLAAGDAAGFDRELDRLQRSSNLLLRGRLTNSRDVTALRQRRDGIAALRLQSDQAYAAASRELQAIEAAVFDDPQVRVPGLLARSREPPAPRDRLSWLDAYETRWRTNQTQRLAALVTTLPDLAAISGAFSSQPFGQATQAVVRLIAQVNAGRLLAGADRTTRNQFAPYADAAQLLAEGLTNRVAALAAMDQATTLAAYFDALARYASRFETDWLASRFDAVLAGRALTLAAVDPVQDFLRRREAITAADAWMKARHAISDLHNIRTLTDLRWVKRKGLDDVAFLQGIEKTEPNLKGQWAPVYLPTATGIQPEFKRAMVLDAVAWGRGLSETPSKAFKHTEIVRDMLDKVTTFTRAEDGESYIEEQFRRVAAMPVWKGTGVPGDNELLNVCFKVQFLLFIAEKMTTISPLPEWQEIQTALKAVDDPDVSWVCFRTTRTRDVDRRGAEALAAIFGPGGPAQRLNVRRAAQQLAGRAPLIWAGQVDRDLAPRIVWRNAAPAAGAAALVGSETRAGKPSPRMLILVDGRHQPQPGQPVLMWADNAPVSQRLKELAALVPDLPPAALAASLPEWFPRP